MSPNSLQPRVPLRLLTVVALVLFACTLRADTIYTNFGTDDAYSSGAGVLVTNDGLAWSSVAVAFTPSANYILNSIEFVASDVIPGDSNDITIGIFADNAGQPGGTALESFTTGPLEQFGDIVPVMTVTSILQPLLQANTQYWIGMNASPGDMIVWNQNLTDANGLSETDGSGNWSTSDPLQGQGVVEIDGTLAPLVLFPAAAQSDAFLTPVPEPGPWWLMSGSLIALGILVRRGYGAACSAPRRPKTTTR